MIMIIICILFILLVFYYFNFYIFNKEYFTTDDNNIKLNIGNYLVKYFYLMGKSFLLGNNFTYKPKNLIFIKDLPSFIPLNINIQNKLIENNFTIDELVKEENEIILVAMWTIINKRREQFWLIMKPIINNILDTTLRKNNLYKEINQQVIHFRCSDIPFIRNGYYFFQRYAFFKDSLEENDLGKNVIFLSCNFHKSNDKNSKTCNIYAESLKKYIENLGYNINVKCSSNLDDFATMFYAPVVISTCSSFSFMAGFFSDGIFISEGHYDSNNREKKCNDCEKWLKNGYSIEHADVDDYYNTDNVIKKLNI
jgi:hypothetical protein